MPRSAGASASTKTRSSRGSSACSRTACSAVSGRCTTPSASAAALTLAAMAVPEARFDEVAAIVNGFPEVAHNYQRTHALNMWFVAATERPERIAAVLERDRGGDRPRRARPAQDRGILPGAEAVGMSAPIDAIDRQIVRATQAGLPLCARPYHAVAEQLGLDPDELMARLRRMLASGIIRRIGAVPNHYRLGYRANGMSVWDVADERIAELGQRVGALHFVSHCYRRPRRPPEWPYNLFAMVHGTTGTRSRARWQRSRRCSAPPRAATTCSTAHASSRRPACGLVRDRCSVSASTCRRSCGRRRCARASRPARW